MPLSKPALIASLACGSCVLIIGVTCLVLGLTGYFTFEEPCFLMKSFEVENFQVDTGGDEGSSSGLLGVLDGLTGGLASQLTPSGVNLTLSLIIEVNNTNAFDLDYEQDREGEVYIVADDISGMDENLYVGDWSVDKGTLKKNAVNELPITVNAALDLTGSTAALAANFVTGGPLSFQIFGGLKGKGWVPGLSGTTDMDCLADMDNVMAIGEDAAVRCRFTTKVPGNRVEDEDYELQVVDPACYV